MSKVKKAVIPAAGLGTRFLPATKAQPKEMLPIVDKPTIQYIIEEAVHSGIEDIIIITGRSKRSIEDHFDKSYELESELTKSNKEEMLKLVQDISNLANTYYIRQKEPLGLGHAIHCAKTFVGNEPFAVLLGDDVVNQTVPLILCAEEDVEGNHGATIGKLDDDMVFYLESRGMELPKIYKMMAKARIDAVLRLVPDEKTKADVASYLESEATNGRI